MATRVDTDPWLQSSSIAVTERQIAALEANRLRLIAMSDHSAANTTAAHIHTLQKALEYHKHVLIAMQARTAIRHLEHA